MCTSNTSDARTSSRALALVAPVFALLMQSPVFGVDYATVYETSFSVDPNWVTDQPANYYWDSVNGVYHATTVNAQPGASPTRYAYTLVNYGGGSFRLEFDINPTSLEWSAGVGLGLFDASLALYPGISIPNPHSIFVHPGRSDAGLSMPLYVNGLNGVSHAEHIGWNLFSEGVWYHCIVQYDQASDAASLTVTERSTGNPVGSAQVTNIGGFPGDMDYLGFARDPAGECCPPVGGGCSGYSCSTSATALLDNVRLLAPVCDDFEDGVIDPTLWAIGGREIGFGGSVYSWSHQEMVAPDGFLQMRIQGPATANTYGAEVWVRTLYDYNDGADHLINFTWGAEVNASHIDGYAISINNGNAPPDGYFPIFGPDSPSNINLYCTVSDLGDRAPCSNEGQNNMPPVSWSIVIDADGHTAALYEGANGMGMLHNLKSLDPAQPWYIRFYHIDSSSAGFPGSDNSLNLYDFCSQGGGACCLTNGTCLQLADQSACDAQSGVFHGLGSSCAGDLDGDTIADTCDRCPFDPTNTKTPEGQCIPTVSQWGLMVMAGLVAAAGGSILAKRRRAAA